MRHIEDRSPEFGCSAIFAQHVDLSKWVSFTVALHDPALFRAVLELTGNVPGDGGLITFPESNWQLSVVFPHQPHFVGQPDDVSVFRGYGLSVDTSGNFVGKPMSACRAARS